MTRRRDAATLVATAAVAFTLLIVGAQRIEAQTSAARACGLLTASELNAGLGFNVTLSPASGICMGPTPNRRTVTLELKPAQKTTPEQEAKIAQTMKQRGIQMNFKAFGSVTCMSGVSEKDKVPSYTSCSAVKGAQMAIITVTAGSEKEMVPVERLRALAEKMATRF